MPSAASALNLAQELAGVSTDDLIGKLQQHVWLVSLTIGYPKFSYQLGEATVEIKTQGGEEKIEVPKNLIGSTPWQLLPAEWRSKFSTFESETRRILSQVSVQFSAKGSALLPIERAPEIFAQLREKRQEFQAIAQEFTTEWPRILHGVQQQLQQHALQVMRKKYDTELLSTEAMLEAERLSRLLYGRASAKLPSQEDLPDKFHLTWCIIPLDSGTSRAGPPATWFQDQRVALEQCLEDMSNMSDEYHTVRLVAENLRDQEQRAARGATNRLAALDQEELIQEARDQMRAFIARSIEDIVTEPREQLLAAVNNLSEALTDENRVVRSGTLAQVERAFATMESFSFLADETLLEKMRACRDQLGRVTPQTLNSNRHVSASLVGALQPLVTAASDMAEAGNMARAFSGVRIRRRPEPEPATSAS